MQVLPQRTRLVGRAVHLCQSVRSRVLLVAVTLLGLYALSASWQTFNGFAVNRAPAYHGAWSAEIMFWYALPGFEAGLLMALLASLAPRAWRHDCSVFWPGVTALSKLVWVLNGFHFLIYKYLFETGSLF